MRKSDALSQLSSAHPSRSLAVFLSSACFCTLTVDESASGHRGLVSRESERAGMVLQVP